MITQTTTLVRNTIGARSFLVLFATFLREEAWLRCEWYPCAFSLKNTSYPKYCTSVTSFCGQSSLLSLCCHGAWCLKAFPIFDLVVFLASIGMSNLLYPILSWPFVLVAFYSEASQNFEYKVTSIKLKTFKLWEGEQSLGSWRSREVGGFKTVQ